MIKNPIRRKNGKKKIVIQSGAKKEKEMVKSKQKTSSKNYIRLVKAHFKCTQILTTANKWIVAICGFNFP